LLEKIIRDKIAEIEGLKEALSIPRQHYKFIDKLQGEEILKQKDQIVARLADEYAMPAAKVV